MLQAKGIVRRRELPSHAAAYAQEKSSNPGKVLTYDDYLTRCGVTDLFIRTTEKPFHGQDVEIDLSTRIGGVDGVFVRDLLRQPGSRDALPIREGQIVAVEWRLGGRGLVARHVHPLKPEAVTVVAEALRNRAA